MDQHVAFREPVKSQLNQDPAFGSHLVFSRQSRSSKAGMSIGESVTHLVLIMKSADLSECMKQLRQWLRSVIPGVSLAKARRFDSGRVGEDRSWLSLSETSVEPPRTCL